VPVLTRLVSVPLTVTPNCEPVEIVPLLPSAAAVAADNTATGSPLRVLKRSFDTVTPLFIVTSAPVSSVKGMVAPPSQLALMIKDEVTIAPPLHNANASLVASTKPQTASSATVRGRWWSPGSSWRTMSFPGHQLRIKGHCRTDDETRADRSLRRATHAVHHYEVRGRSSGDSLLFSALTVRPCQRPSQKSKLPPL